MSPNDVTLAEIQKSLALIDTSLRRIALALEAIAHKTDEHFKTPAETQREQARQHITAGSKSRKPRTM
jgi:hypothetical protein